MQGMSPFQHATHSTLAAYLGMWMAMMVPMMLPALIPWLVRYRRSMREVEGVRLHGLTVLAGAGYFAVWAMLGVAVWAFRGALAVTGIHGLPVGWQAAVTGTALLAAGGLQFTPWKDRQLSHGREPPRWTSGAGSAAAHAWRQGLGTGLRCGRSCAGLMLPFLVLGMAKPIAMIAVTVAITAERLVPAPRPVARVTGAVLLLLGLSVLLPAPAPPTPASRDGSVIPAPNWFRLTRCQVAHASARVVAMSPMVAPQVSYSDLPNLK